MLLGPLKNPITLQTLFHFDFPIDVKNHMGANNFEQKKCVSFFQAVRIKLKIEWSLLGISSNS